MSPHILLLSTPNFLDLAASQHPSQPLTPQTPTCPRPAVLVVRYAVFDGDGNHASGMSLPSRSVGWPGEMRNEAGGTVWVEDRRRYGRRMALNTTNEDLDKEKYVVRWLAVLPNDDIVSRLGLSPPISVRKSNSARLDWGILGLVDRITSA
jgi:hypothetical protein